MKFLHLGDLHLGKSLSEFDLFEDQKYILEQIVSIAASNMVDAVLIAGDVYDKSVPSEKAVNLLDYFLKKLVQAKIKVFMISGNHDSDERLQFGSSFFESKDIYICARYEGKLYKRELEDEFGRLNIYLLPFIKASQVKAFFPDKAIDSYDKAVKIVIENADINQSERNIIVAHQFVAGKGSRPTIAGSEGAQVIALSKNDQNEVGLVEQIAADTFDIFDYAALGHIHAAQKISREEVRYSGSPLKYSLSEAKHDKSVPIITIGEKGNVKIELVVLTPLRNLRHIKGKMKILLDSENIVDTKDFIYITLTDEDIVNDAMSIFSQYYPNIIKLDYDNQHTKDIENVDISQITKDKSFEEILSEFYSLMYGCEMTEEELEVMKAVAKEAGVEDET